MNKSYDSHNRHKTCLQFHIIFVCKYRKPLLKNTDMATCIKNLSQQICKQHDVLIETMEVDDDHIHYLIKTPPTLSISDLVRVMKSYTTYHAWKKHPRVLSTYFWNEKTFWSDGYFAATIGDVSEKTLKEYIESQG